MSVGWMISVFVFSKYIFSVWWLAAARVYPLFVVNSSEAFFRKMVDFSSSCHK